VQSKFLFDPGIWKLSHRTPVLVNRLRLRLVHLVPERHHAWRFLDQQGYGSSSSAFGAALKPKRARGAVSRSCLVLVVFPASFPTLADVGQLFASLTPKAIRLGDLHKMASNPVDPLNAKSPALCDHS
jgi:hypothetical protein